MPRFHQFDTSVLPDQLDLKIAEVFPRMLASREESDRRQTCVSRIACNDSISPDLTI